MFRPCAAVLLAQAIGNLIDNSLKCTGEKGVIRVEVQSQSDRRVRITVADNGPASRC